MAKGARSQGTMTMNVPFLKQEEESKTTSPDGGKKPADSGFTTAEAIKLIENMKTNRLPFDTQYQAIAEVVDGNNADFSDQFTTEGSFTQDDIYDSEAVRAAQVSGAAFVGMMWPNGAKSVQVIFKNDEALKDAESKKWLEKKNRLFVSALDDPRGNLNNALGELSEDSMKYGTVALTRVPGGDGPNEPIFRFDAWNVRNFYIAQGRDRQPDTLAIVYKDTADGFVKRFGYHNCSVNVQKAYNENRLDTKFDYLHVIKPRKDRDPSKAGNLNAPWLSAHFDLSNKKKMKESGFGRRAFYVSRFYVRPGELYARSPCMNVLPDIYLANALKEAIILATEKQLDPPLGILDDSTLGNAVVDTSAGGLSVFNPPPGGGNSPPVFPLYTVGDMKSAIALLEELHANIKNGFFLDRLLDLNNETQMTAREALIRDAMRSTTLRTPINRMISDIYTPMVEDSWMDMMDRGYFGLMPNTPEWLNAKANMVEVDEIPEVVARLLAAGEEVFEVKYMTPAMKDMKADESQAIIDQMGLVANLTPAYPQARNQLNIMKALDRLANNRGVPVDLLNTEEERAAIEAVQDQKQQEAAVLQNLGSVAGIAKQLGVTPSNGQPQ